MQRGSSSGSTRVIGRHVQEYPGADLQPPPASRELIGHEERLRCRSAFNASGTAEQHLLHEQPEANHLKLGDAMPFDDITIVEDRAAEVNGALVASSCHS